MNAGHNLSIRPARHSDQGTIRHMVRAARLAPFNLKWPAFLVAEINGRIIGIGQVKSHRDGSRELASLAVAPEYQGQGVGSALVQALLDRESGPVYLFCREELGEYYARFGFKRAPRQDLPEVMAWLLGLANIAVGLLTRFNRQTGGIIAMQNQAGR